MNQVNLYRPAPSGLPQNQMRAAFNNSLANAYAMGDPRANLKQLDRAGLSRGAGQMNQAGINAANSMVDAISQAYSQNLQNQAYNANVGLQGQQAQENFAQALGGLNAQQNYAQQMAALQRQQAGVGMVQSLLGGLLG